MTTKKVLDLISFVEDEQVELFIEQQYQVKEATIIGFVNQHAYNLVAKSTKVAHAFSQVDTLLRDGIGIKLLCKMKGIKPGANLNGTDLIPSLVEYGCQSSKNCHFFAFGTEQPWLDDGAAALFGNVNYDCLDGFLDEQAYVDFIIKQRASLSNGNKFPVIVLAMGMPKQEQVAIKLKSVLKMPALIICGGAIIDFKAKRFKRAPEWMRNNGMEWLYRLLSEPTRLFKRYVFGIPLFFYNFYVKGV